MKESFGALRAFWKLDWRLRRRDARGLLQSAFTAVTMLVLAVLTVPLVSPAFFGECDGCGDGSNWVLHITTGYVCLAVLAASVPALRDRLRRYQETGFLEACVMTRTPLWKTLVATPVYDVFVEVLLGLALLAVVLPGMPQPPSGASLALAALFLAIGTGTCILLGLASASMTLALRASDPMATVVMGVALVCGGAVVPRELLPEPLAWLGALTPVAPMLDGLRMTLEGGAWSEPLAAALTHLLTLSAAMSVICLATIAWALRRVLGDGAFSAPS
jgi:ABC-2 type transport system permease protein